MYIHLYQNWTDNTLRGCFYVIILFKANSLWVTLCLGQVPVVSWFDDMDDAELLNLLPVFEELSQAEDVYTQLDLLRGH